MKKHLITVCIVVFSLSGISAQQIQLGTKAGANFASMNGDYEIGFDAGFRTSFHAGLLAEIMLTEKFSLQPELTYSSQGFKYETEELLWGITEITLKGVSKLDYLNLPLMGKFYLTEGLSVQVGPQVGFLLSAKREIETPEIPIIGEIVIPAMTIVDDVKGNYKNIDFGANIGIGYTLESNVFFDVRAYLGLLNANNNIFTSGIIEAQNAMIQVSVGYLF